VGLAAPENSIDNAVSKEIVSYVRDCGYREDCRYNHGKKGAFDFYTLHSSFYKAKRH